MVCEGSRRSSIRGDARISQSHSEYSINFSFNFVAQMPQRRCDRLCLWNHCLNYKTQKRKTSDVFQKLQRNRGRMITVPILRNSNSFSKRISEVDDCLVKQRWFMLPSTLSTNHQPLIQKVIGGAAGARNSNQTRTISDFSVNTRI